MEIGLREWFLRRDPDLLAVRRAARVTVVACLGFYVCYYLVGRPVTATKLHEACGVLANALYEGREPRIAPLALEPAP